jgi:hypothetical protein
MSAPHEDRADLIVGSWYLPEPIKRVPMPVWAFAVATLADAVLRAMSFGGGPRIVAQAPEALFIALSFLPEAARNLFLPGAVLVGNWVGRTRQLVLGGALLIAGGEVVSLVITVVARGIPGDAGDLFDLVARFQAFDGLWLVAAVLGLAGSLLIASGLRPMSLPGGRRARIATAVILIVALLGAVAEIVTLVAVVAYHPEGASEGAVTYAVITPPGLLSQVVGILNGLVWGTIACFAVIHRQRATRSRRGWSLLSVGASLLVLWGTIGALPLALAFTASDTLLTTYGAPVIQLNSAIHVVGVVCLLAGFASRSVDETMTAPVTRLEQPERA